MKIQSFKMGEKANIFNVVTSTWSYIAFNSLVQDFAQNRHLHLIQSSFPEDHL